MFGKWATRLDLNQHLRISCPVFYIELRLDLGVREGGDT